MTAVALVAFASCCNCTMVANSGGALGDTAWQLIQIEGRTLNVQGDAYTLNFAAGNNVSGKGDCNRLTGTYTSDKATGTLSFGPMASTRMMCPNQTQEDLFVRLIGAIDAYKIERNLLMLFSNGELKMIMEKK